MRLPIISCLITALIAVLYWPGLAGGFVFDDFVNIVENPKFIAISKNEIPWWSAAFSGGAGPLARPISVLSFALEVYFFGLQPYTMKVVNLVLHLINVWLVFGLSYAIGRSFWDRYPLLPSSVSPCLFAILVATAWGVLPINLTGVLYVVQRMENLSTLFMLAGLWAYVHGRGLINSDACTASAGWRWVCFGMFGFGLLAVFSKENGVMLPVYALLIEWMVFFKYSDAKAKRNIYFLYGIVLFLPGVLGLAWILPGLISGAAYESRPFTLSERLWTEARVVWGYLAWILAPSMDVLSLYHDAYEVSTGPLSPPASIFGVIGIFLLICVSILLRKDKPWLAFGILWFFVMHLLVSTVVPLELVYEHRNYMGSVGVMWVVFGLLLFHAHFGRWRLVIYFFIFALLTWYVGVTYMRSNEWSHPVKHAYFESQRQSNSPRAVYELGVVLNRLNPDPGTPGFHESVSAFRRAADLPNTTFLPYQALLFLNGKKVLLDADVWWGRAENYIVSHPLSNQDVNALYGLLEAQISGEIQLDSERLVNLLREAYRVHSWRSDISAMYANSLLNLIKDVDEAGLVLSQAVVQSPRDVQMWMNLISVQLILGHFREAQEGIERVQELDRWGHRDGAIQALQQKLDQLSGRLNEKKSMPR